jgi:hypothetical protein
MCKQYDKLMLIQKRKMGWVDVDATNSEFGLIKKSITIITSLEELVQHAAQQISQAWDDAAGTVNLANQECLDLK